MFPTMWLISVLTLLVVDVRTGALQHEDVEPRQCHVCSHNGTTSCEQLSSWSTALCPNELPYCATITIAPNFMSSLSCAAAAERPCSLTLSPTQTELTCVCTTQLCNAPFTEDLKNELLNFTYTPQNNDTTDITDIFLKLTKFANLTDAELFDAVIVKLKATEVSFITNSSQLTTLKYTPSMMTTMKNTNHEMLPKAVALKNEATVPSDDDEDDGEGSGFEEIRQRRPASAPAAPSSYLPANENKASMLFINKFLVIPLFVYVIL